MVWTRSFTDSGASGSAAGNLLTLGSWKRELWRLLNTSASDEALTEHDDADIELEAVLVACQHGLDAAQEWLLANGLAGWWVTRSSALTWLGADATGGQYTTLPDDFRRLAGDHNRSAMVNSDGIPWGQLVEWEDRHKAGRGYFFRDGKLYLLRRANPPSDLYLEYVRRLTIPSDDTTTFTEFPRWALPLIPAYAAEYLMDEAFLAGGQELEAKVARRLARLQQKTINQLRLHQGPRRMRSDPVLGNRYWI